MLNEYGCSPWKYLLWLWKVGYSSRFLRQVSLRKVVSGSRRILRFPKPTAKFVRKVDGKTPTPAQTTNTSETVVKTSEKIVASSQGLSETTYVHRVMQRQPRYCFEYQSVDEVRKTMLPRRFRAPSAATLTIGLA